jgi:hypothetical protein
MSTVLDPGAATLAGAAHGQVASTLPGGIAVSGHKVVEEGARALLLIVPGLIRIDVCPLEDGLQVIPRALIHAQVGWEVDETALRDYGRTAEQHEQPAVARFTFGILLEPRPVGGRLLLSYTRGREHGPTHFVGHAIVVEFGADA